MVIASLTLWQDQSINPLAGIFSGGMLLVVLAVAVVAIIGLWKVFEKAGQPGWACIIPLYNVYILMKIAGRPAWWLILFFVPLANIVVGIIVAMDVAKAFGQSAMFGFFLLFLFAGIGYLILGFGNYQYRGPATRAMAAAA